MRKPISLAETVFKEVSTATKIVAKPVVPIATPEVGVSTTSVTPAASPSSSSPVVLKLKPKHIIIGVLVVTAVVLVVREIKKRREEDHQISY